MGDFSQLKLDDVIPEEVEKDESVDLDEALARTSQQSVRSDLWLHKDVQEEPKPTFYAGEEIEVKCIDGNWYRAYLRMFNGETEECDITFLGKERKIHPDLMIRSPEDCCSGSNSSDYYYFSGSDSPESDAESDPGQTRRSTPAKTLSERMRRSL